MLSLLNIDTSIISYKNGKKNLLPFFECGRLLEVKTRCLFLYHAFQNSSLHKGGIEKIDQVLVWPAVLKSRVYQFQIFSIYQIIKIRYDILICSALKLRVVSLTSMGRQLYFYLRITDIYPLFDSHYQFLYKIFILMTICAVIYKHGSTVYFSHPVF